MWFQLLLLFVGLSHAEDPEYLLSDHGVRLELPRPRWHMSRWSTEDFEGRLGSEPVLLYAWTTPVRAPVAPPEPWGQLFVEKAESIQGSDVKVDKTAAHEAGGHTFAYVDLSFSLPTAGAIVMLGATTELDSKNLHIAIVAPRKLASVARRERDEVVSTMVFVAEVADPDLGGALKTERFTSTLPSDFRLAHDDEMGRVTAIALKLGVEDLTPCWTAVRGQPNKSPDVLVGCQRTLHLGVVDEHSLAAADLAAKEELFGPSIPDGKAVSMPDRTGIVWEVRDGLAMGLAPDGEQVSVVFGVGEGDLAGPITQVLSGATFVEPHAVGVGDHLGYWLKHRTLSAQVLCPSSCCCAVVGLGFVLVLGVMGLRSRRRPDEEDE